MSCNARSFYSMYSLVCLAGKPPADALIAPVGIQISVVSHKAVSVYGACFEDANYAEALSSECETMFWNEKKILIFSKWVIVWFLGMI